MRRYTEILAVLALSAGMALHAQTNEMVIQTRKLGAEIQPTMYGLFFEDINYAADGGLYAELVKNRSFEFPQHLMGWKTYGKVTLQETLERQNEILNSQITDLNKAKRMCEKMLGEESISYEKLQVEQYVTELQDYWKDNQTVFKLDSVSFLYIWGSMLTWITITVLCLIIGALSYSKLPVKIPVQWSKGVATSLVNKNWIFICPVICIIIRYLLKPFIYAKLQMNNYYGDIITEYLTNYMCFIVLSVEIFSILFTFGVVKNIVVLLFVDTVVFIGLLVVGLTKMDLRGKEIL